MANAIRKFVKVGGQTFKERLVIKTFKHAHDMHTFLSTSDNGLFWREGRPDMPDKAGTYAYAGGKYHDVKKLDPSILAHI